MFIVVALGLVLIGPTVADRIAVATGAGNAFAMVWKIVQWPFAFALVTLGLGLVYYFGPDAEQDWEWVTPGAVLGTLLWLMASLAFKLYVTQFGTYNETYGSLGGVIVLMLWFYLSSLAILIGAEMNAEIEHASPHGKAPGEKVPGERKKLGAAAAREFATRHEARRYGAPRTGSAGAVPGNPIGGRICRRVRGRRAWTVAASQAAIVTRCPHGSMRSTRPGSIRAAALAGIALAASAEIISSSAAPLSSQGSVGETPKIHAATLWPTAQVMARPHAIATLVTITPSRTTPSHKCCGAAPSADRIPSSRRFEATFAASTP